MATFKPEHTAGSVPTGPPTPFPILPVYPEVTHP